MKPSIIQTISNDKNTQYNKTKYNNVVLTQAEIAVAKAIPISLKELIKINDKITLQITLTIEIYRGVFVSSLAKKHTTNTFINIYTVCCMRASQQGLAVGERHSPNAKTPGGPTYTPVQK